MVKGIFFGLLCCALATANVNNSVDNEEKRAIIRDGGSELNVVTMYDNNAIVYSDSSYKWNYCFEQMKAKHKEITDGGGQHSFRCVIEMATDEFVDNFDSASYLPMPIEINMHGHTITLNYGDYWNIDHGLKINGDGGTIKTTREKTDYNCSIFVDGGDLEVYSTKFENFHTNMKYPLFATGNKTTRPVFNNCTFTKCSSATYGGAICVERTESLRMENCKFDYCSSKYGGAIYAEDIIAVDKVDAISVRFCSFTLCSASHSGGAIYLYNNKTPDENLVFDFYQDVITDCFANSYGGGIYLDCYDAGLNMTGSKMDRCATYHYGGGIYSHNDRTSISQCEIFYGSAEYGAGVYFNGRSPELYHVTIHDCNANKSGGAYYARYVSGEESLDIYYPNFYNNSPSDGNATAMSSGSLVILFGVLSGVFLISTCVFVYLYLRKRKENKLEANK